jgi:thymidylate synthase
MFQVFEGRTANEAWDKIATVFHTNTGLLTQTSRFGPTREILHAAISVSDPRQRWVVARNPPMSIAFALAEVIWIMAGRNDSAFLNYFNKGLPNYAGHGPCYHGAYGYRLRKKFNIDQMERAYRALTKNPDSRQIVLQIWDATDDLPTIDGIPLAADIPCNIVSILKVRGGALEWTQIMRSNDIFRGLPYNFVQFTSMQEILAGWLNINVGSYNHVSDSLHIYERDLSSMESEPQLNLTENADSLALPKQDFDLVLSELENNGNCIIDDNTAAATLLDTVRSCKLPTAYRNILCVLSAEGVRKRKRPDLVGEIMGLCTNPAYNQLWGRWSSRFAGGKIENTDQV